MSTDDLPVRLEEKDIEAEIKEVNEIFRYNLRMLRASEELTGETLALKIGMTSKRINNLECGHTPPTFEDLIRIVDYFPITFNDLLEYKLGLNIKYQTLQI